ncbi:MAG: metallophosphoesterase [Verrucomicrobiota bacterium]
MKRRTFLGISLSAAAAHSAVPSDRPLASIGVVADVQYADADPQGERHYRSSLPKLRAAVKDLAERNLLFTIHLGDLIDRDFQSFASVLPLWEPLRHEVKHVLGNHDFTVAAADQEKVPALLGLGKGYHAYTAAGIRWICLDTNEVSVYRNSNAAKVNAARGVMARLAKEGKKNAQPWNGGISAAQLKWLDNELAEAGNQESAAIVYGHHPLLPEDSHHAWNHQEILDVFAKHGCVRAYLSGHNHDGAESRYRGIPLITFRSLLHRPETTAYSVLHVFRDRLRIDGSGREPSRTIHFG